MPVRALVVGVFAVSAVGYIVYDQREHVLEFVDLSRQKIAELLRLIADKVSSEERRREEVPMAGRQFSYSSSSSSHDEKRAAEPETTAATGRDVGELGGHLRHRGAEPHEGSTVIFDSTGDSSEPPTYNKEAAYIAPAVAAVASQNSSSITAVTPENLQHLAPNENASESGYGTAAPQPQAQSFSRHTASLSSRTISISDNSDHTAPENPFVNPQPFWSIHEWQENTTQDAPADRSTSPSLAGSAADDLDTISDIASDFGSDHGTEPGSVGSWTEVASEFSDDHLA
ncbi:hypothetical protein K440DRAFT_620323 [Wilcoxina mikolae CBS 423.85]|nr:hypothetical protein K440DRAFT_620323 [Wilcoxina mikolae CBS 423.85]